MATTALFRALVVLAAAVAVAGDQSFTTYRTEEDIKASGLAEQRVEEACADVDLSNIDEKGGRKALEGALRGGDNVILQVLTEADNTDQMGNLLQEKVNPGWLIGIAGPMVFSFILAFVWFICCWSACPFCRCCRCCQRQRKSPIWVKLILMVAIGALIFGTVVSAMLAFKGRNDIKAGLNSVSCTAARVLESTLNGNKEGKFIGMLPLLDEFGLLRSRLYDDSPLIENVNRILDNTKEVMRAQFIAVESMKLLADTLNLNKDQPGMSDDIEQLASGVREASEAISDGVASALASARSEVNTQLGPESRASLRDTLDGAVQPLRDGADKVRDSFKFFLEDGFADIKGTALQITSIAVVVIALTVFSIMACGCGTGLLCVFRDYSKDLEEASENPWNKYLAPCACSTWCCGWGYAFLVFFFGGLMIICAVLMSSMCLVLDDLDSQMLQDILPSLGSGTELGPEFDMVTDMIDTCFSKKTPDTGRSLLDIIFVEENGVRVTLDEQIRGQTVTPIRDQFKVINEKMSETDVRLTEQEGVKDLMTALRDFPAPPAGVPPQPGFRCDLFQKPAGIQCDVLNMVKASGNWVSDCVQGSDDDMIMEPWRVDCTSTQFSNYMVEWADRIDKVLGRVDDAVASTKTKIATDLQSVVDKYVITPVEKIVDQAQCSFLKNAYADLVNGFCYRGVVGFTSVAEAYVANGVLTLFLIIVMYVVWRVSVDNRNTWGDEVTVIGGKA